jgi:WD40 repeat protein
VWSVASCTVIARLDGHASYVRGVAWDPVGSYLYALSARASVLFCNTLSMYSQGDDGLRCWKIDTWQQHSERTFEAPYGRCSEEVLYHRLGVSPDGSHIAAIGITKDKLNVCSISHRADLSPYRLGLVFWLGCGWLQNAAFKSQAVA